MDGMGWIGLDPTKTDSPIRAPAVLTISHHHILVPPEDIYEIVYV